MDINQLKYFILTARLQNMSQAARLLGITQPTLSKSIANLEKELGTRLFDRAGKKLILNERGKRFLDGASDSLEELESAALSAREEGVDATLSMGLFCISERFMGCLGAFCARYPNTVPRVYLLYGSPAQIDTNEFDVLLYPGDSMFQRYKGQLAYSESYLLAVPRSNALAGKTRVSVAELSGERLIFYRNDKKGFAPPYRLYHSSGAAPHSYMYTNSYELQRQMISAGCGVGFVPEGCRRTYEADERIALIPIADEGFTQDILIGFKREKHLSASGRLFASFAGEYFEL